jgi:hypothetical protein
MDQQPYMPIIDQQTSLHILAFPKELFTNIALFMYIEFQLALAHTCKTIYGYHKEQYREERAAFLCSSLINVNRKYKYCKALERWLSETGWAAVKVIPKEIETNSQSNNSYPIRALCLDNSPQFPNGLKCESINALLLKSFLNISFLGNFPNLKIVSLSSVNISENIVLILSKLSLLKTISLKHCAITEGRLSKIFENCTTLKEIKLLRSGYGRATMFPPQVRIFCVEYEGQYTQMNLSRCTRLQSL